MHITHPYLLFIDGRLQGYYETLGRAMFEANKHSGYIKIVHEPSDGITSTVYEETHTKKN